MVSKKYRSFYTKAFTILPQGWQKYISANVDYVHYVAYKITRPDTIVAVSPMNIVALPGDNNGDVELLVEASTDLMSWTPIYSGSAGTSNNAAFIRTRLIQN